MKARILLLNVLILIFITASCKKGTVANYNVTPMPLLVPIPSYVSQSFIGDMPHPVDNPITIDGVKLGRKLFYEKKLSGDNTMSCASCHFQEFGFGDPLQFSVGIDGDAGNRQAMTIINAAWSPSLFWDGRAASLEDQAFGPVTNPIELNDTWPNVVAKLQADSEYPNLFKNAFGTNIIDSVLVAKAIAQFERTLVSFDTRFDKYFYGLENVLTPSEENGFNLYFGDAECIHCHSGPLLSVFADLGLGAITGLPTDDGKFRMPTLRNIAQTAPYMHDGRFATLEEVVDYYNSDVLLSSPNLDPEMFQFTGGLNLSDQDKADLVAFLKTFTDESFLTKTHFSDPN